MDHAQEQVEIDRRYMRRALELATRGRGFVSPNPMVGAVIVDGSGAIIGEGWHERFGGPHAEINALRQVEGRDLSDATLYVTLEPCSHHGKTPPCAVAVAETGIRRIVVAMRDPNPLVSGRGNKILRAAGREVIVGILEQEAMRLNEAWIHFIKTGKPFVTMKVAQSLDGYIALPGGESQWITGELARRRVHELRAAADAVLVGTRTALADDPSLTVREGINGRNPRRVILDRYLELPDRLKVFSDDYRELTVVVTAEEMIDDPKAVALRELGVSVLGVPIESNPENLRLDAVVERLGELNVTNLLVEGGAAVVDTFAAQGLPDKLILFIAPKLLGHGLKPFAPLAVQRLSDACTLKIHRTEQVGEDLMVEGYWQ